MGNLFASLFGKKKDINEKKSIITKKFLEEETEFTKDFIDKTVTKIKEKEQEILRGNTVVEVIQNVFKDRVPKELDERVKKIVKQKIKGKYNITEEELAIIISNATVTVIEDLSIECEEEYKLVKTILTPKYGNGKWPTKKKLEDLIDKKDFPWLKSQIDKWPEEKDIISCSQIKDVRDKITINNRCIFSSEYSEIKNKCDVTCGKGIEGRTKRLIKNINKDFPSFQKCEGDLPYKEFVCDTKKICKEDCKIQIDTKSFGEAKCSKPCDSGDGPGEKTYKIKYLSSSKGEPDNMGSCEIDEKGKVVGQTYNITVPCNKKKCPDCKIESKGPYKDDYVDYTRSVTINGNNKTYTACLLPQEDGNYEDIDCGGAEGGFNYNKGARSKYNMKYKVTKDAFGVQNCTKGEDIIEEGCPVNAFEPNLLPIVGNDGKLLIGGGEECGNECILSDDYPKVVEVDKKECSKTCGGGIKRMRKVVKRKSDAPYCPCKYDESACPYEEIPCNTQDCIADCVYPDGEDTKHVQINDPCPGTVKGINENVKWDTIKEKWYVPSEDKYYPRSHFMKHLRVPTLTPTIGKGKCYQGNKADRHENCSIELDGVKRPIDGYWKPWKFVDYTQKNLSLSTVDTKYINWDDSSNPNSKDKIDKRVKARLDAKDKDSVTGEILSKGTIEQEEKHCIDEDYLSFSEGPTKEYERERVLAKYNGDEAEGDTIKSIPYMKKGTGYTRYCPVDAPLFPETWISVGNQMGAQWEYDKCYNPDGSGGRVKRYSVSELKEEAKKKFIRDSNLPNYDPPRDGEKRIIGAGSRSIFKYKDRDDDDKLPEKHGGLPVGKWHSTIGDQSDVYDKRTREYGECEGVEDILDKINKKIPNKNPEWEAEDRYVHQKDCNPVYEWDGKYYANQDAAMAGESGEEIKTHSDTGKVDLSSEPIPGSILSKDMYPASGMKQTNKGKFLTNAMHDHCQKPGLDSSTGWCGLNSTDNFLQMITDSGGIERIKGVVIQGRKGNSMQWVETFEVYVSRNGHSWKQVKDASGSTMFTGNNSDNRFSKIKNYFHNNEIVEAKYIRFRPRTWNNWNSMRIGYIKDLSGTIDCTGGDGMQGSTEPWYRLTFNKQKTIDSGGYSEGKHSSTKICPPDGEPLTYQRGGNISTDYENIKLYNDNKVSKKSLKEKMNELSSGLPSCGKDAVRTGWRSSDSEGSFSWSDCVKADSKGLETSTLAWNANDYGYRYMYNKWKNFSDKSDYKEWSNDLENKANSMHPSGPTETLNNGSIVYKGIPTSYTNADGHKYNIIRQACHRGVKGVPPKLSTKKWVSTIPSSANEQVGYKGTVWNLEGGKEGWIDSKVKYTWGNKFQGKIDDLVGKDMYKNKINSYKVIEIEGTNDNKRNTDSHPWSDGSKAYGGHIGGNKAYHSTGYDANNWNSSLNNSKSVAKYKNDTKFYAVGVKIQPRSGYHTTQAPTKIRLYFADTNIDVTLGTFADGNDVKTILIDPTKRKLTNKFYVYSRHGRDSQAVSFRINFIIGKKGEGYSVDQGKNNIRNGNKEPVDCSIGDWTDWTACGATCGGGKQTRTRSIIQPSYGGKNDCKADATTEDEQDCNTHVCPVDCIGKWNDWEYDGNNAVSNVKDDSKDEHGCNYTRTCYDGYIRTYTHQQSKKGSGKDCPHKSGATQLKVGGWVCSSWKKGNCFIDTSGSGGGGGGGGGCIGSNTIIFTDKGYLKLKDIKVGDKVKNRYGQWSEVYYVRNHGFKEIEHLQIEFEDNVKVSLTKEHLLYNSRGERVRADSLKIGDYVFGQQKIVNIRKIMDIPLTPCIIDGSLNIGNKIISCWSHNEENAKKMDKISIMAKKILDSGTTVFELSEIAHNFYNQYHSGKKDLSIMKNLVSDYLNKKSLETINVK